MHADYPAAHSMDTLFFVVDAAGQVAVFDTGENGHALYNYESDNSFYDLWRLRNPNTPPEQEDLFEEDYIEPEDRARILGLYMYIYTDEQYDPIAPYTRTLIPDVPMHVDQLPPEMRQRCRETTFSTLHFHQTESVQPLEFFPCVYWYQEDRVAYLCADGVTVRPIPGQENRFAAFVQQWQRNDPTATSGLIFEGPTE